MNFPARTEEAAEKSENVCVNSPQLPKNVCALFFGRFDSGKNNYNLKAVKSSYCDRILRSA
jgi:hypothetical protein